MKLTNETIYSYAMKIKNFCDEEADSLLPAKCSFYIYKNLNTLLEAANCIDKARQNILEKYGKQEEEENVYIISDENKELAQEELTDLGNITQDIQIYFIQLTDLEKVNLTLKQLFNISFMIQEESNIIDEQKEDNLI